ncbi:MAG: chorismate synthase [Verrucomicrobia bacterium CG_4_10_14_3_um_filter_43_23]|nr:MAG: chorismate synthase [Verrucomicrobia bacterium CG1_02_43_26]PIP59816.1 MAG: chorismate synthase [Verrucomicrobia bacterium CG22_combo_CG10-13_8_21_14_all_43_17]PIX57828.1 MAG: chorismate synthase [Verrucomicrobia bacterium CG_4_10_14_3_um_filter_43_23]PIY63033.1 MAG: chorismate synthase [Verrucomicrobia bacterium CG_4_10_14_0_8_um_filter_43_34]PJA43719.1 MAG: chorismate synthase [Verrucomicrobia bacterium CG_4_9_14_3_um_filter_43_20]
MGNIFGEIFRITTFGESHGGGVGVVIDGCPPNLPLEALEIQKELDRRRPGQSAITTPRNEADEVVILSGLYQGKTLGSPIAMLVYNKDARPEAYNEMRDKFRPSHADFTYQTKYGHRNPEGGGRSSARETIGRVAAGAIAKKILSVSHGIEIRAYVDRVYDIQALPLDHFPTIDDVEKNIIRCPDDAAAAKMIHLIEKMREEGDSVGGGVLCRVKSLPVGLGEPVFDRLEADLAKAMLSLPATKAFEIGSGFAGTHMKGSEHNDAFEMKEGKVSTKTNYSGGIQGGISNGEELYFRVGFKPTATILKKQQTVDLHHKETELIGRGRHDPCVLPRAVPIVEAMAALVLLDHVMRDSAQCHTFDFSNKA